jgi:hypothetical protein
MAYLIMKRHFEKKLKKILKDCYCCVFYIAAHFAASFVHGGGIFYVIISCSIYQSLKKIAVPKKVHALNSLQIYLNSNNLFPLITKPPN